jgi:DNA-binding transcriptional ArsR family regulator
MKKNSSTYHVFFTNLANPLKVDIILSLREKQKNVTDLTKDLGVEQSKLSHALSSLRDCKIVKMKQQGKQRIYSLNQDTVIPMLKLIDKHASKHCDCTACNIQGCKKR